MNFTAMRAALAASALLMTACEQESMTEIRTPPTAASHQVQVTFAGDGAGTVSVGATSVGSTAITCTTGGTACAAPVPGGTTLSLTATPAAGSTFGGWTGGTGCGTAPTCAIRVDAPQTVTATFARIPMHALTVRVIGSGAGSVASTPAGIACTGAGSGLQTGSCETAVTVSTTVTLTATPAAGSIFRGWSGTGAGGCVGTEPCTVLVSAAQTVTATFSPSTGTLAIAAGGSGSGVVTSTPAGIICTRAVDGTASGTCASSFAFGSAVTLTASPTAGSVFVGWSGACSGTDACTVTIGDAQAVTATFAPPPPTLYALTIAMTGAGSGSVTSTPAGIGCTRAGGGQTGDCGTTVVSGTSVTLTATPSAGSTFVGWSGGGCSGAGACTVPVTAAQTVSATFGVPTPQVALTVTTAGVGGGTVTSSPAGIGCTRTPASQGGEPQTGACAATFDGGRTVTLTATPVAGSTFQGWSGAGCSGTGSCVVTMGAAQGVTATFGVVTAPPPMPQTIVVTLTTAGTGQGSVMSGPSGILCTRTSSGQGGICTGVFTSGSVTLTAIPTPGHLFAGWSGACTGTGDCTVSSTQAVTATFTVAPAPAVLTVTTTGSGGGSVSSSPSGIACTRSAGAQSGTCSNGFPVGTTVTLTAMPTSGSTFAGWTGTLCSGVGPCTVVLGAAYAVTATFTSGPVARMALTVSATGTGNGTVTSSPSGVSCTHSFGVQTGTCTAEFDVGTNVTLLATPVATRSAFTAWGGACGTGTPTCPVTMTAARSVSATFADIVPPTVSLSGVVSGATYPMHPSILLAYADDMGFGASPLRITWSRVTSAGVLQCAFGIFGNEALFSTATGSTCPAFNAPGLGALTASGAAAYTLTVQSRDAAGNLSAPAGVSYTVGS